jgi:hypothetical protein
LHLILEVEVLVALLVLVLVLVVAEIASVGGALGCFSLFGRYVIIVANLACILLTRKQ